MDEELRMVVHIREVVFLLPEDIYWIIGAQNKKIKWSSSVITQAWHLVQLSEKLRYKLGKKKSLREFSSESWKGSFLFFQFLSLIQGDYKNWKNLKKEKKWVQISVLTSCPMLKWMTNGELQVKKKDRESGFEFLDSERKFFNFWTKIWRKNSLFYIFSSFVLRVSKNSMAIGSS